MGLRFLNAKKDARRPRLDDPTGGLRKVLRGQLKLASRLTITIPAGCAGLRLVLPIYMALIPESVRQQLEDRFQTVLSGSVHLPLYTRPGSSRLILPAGLGRPPCEDAGHVADLLRH